jgi:hypothetical protein
VWRADYWGVSAVRTRLDGVGLWEGDDGGDVRPALVVAGADVFICIELSHLQSGVAYGLLGCIGGAHPTGRSRPWGQG